jgi:hypothetical protein
LIGSQQSKDFIRKLESIMSLRQLSSRIELSFWHIVIGLLSESQSLQRLIRWFYLDFLPATTNSFQRFDSQRVIRWAALGLGLGFVVGFLISLF